MPILWCHLFMVQKSGKLMHNFEGQHIDYLWGGGRSNLGEQLLVSETPLLV